MFFKKSTFFVRVLLTLFPGETMGPAKAPSSLDLPNHAEA